jgi:hypothetical protein
VAGSLASFSEDFVRIRPFEAMRKISIVFDIFHLAISTSADVVESISQSKP